MAFTEMTRGNVPMKIWDDGGKVPMESGAIAQLAYASMLPIIGPHVALMADGHVGIGSTVGSVIPTRKAIIPAAVGVDIGCVDLETEFLSPQGWKKISDYNGEPILQCDAEGNGSWIIPEYIKLPCDSFFHFKTKYGVDQMLSEEHRVLCWRIIGRDRRRVQEVSSAADLAAEHNKLKLGLKIEYLVSFSLPESEGAIPLSDAALRVQVMLMADAHVDMRHASLPRPAILRLKKQRKINRAKILLEEAGLNYTVHVNGNVTVIRFDAPLPDKSYRNWFGRCTKHQLEIITDECLNWDGNKESGVFFTRDKDSADFIQYAFSATGGRASIVVDNRESGIDYRVIASSDTMVGLNGSPKTPVQIVPSQDGYKYCFKTETGFWLMRRHGDIVVTGNCGMVAVRTTLTSHQVSDNAKDLFETISEAVPHGGQRGKETGNWDRIPQMSKDEWERLKPGFRSIVDKHGKASSRSVETQLGTLGGGNHFIEVCLDETDHVWFMLHSGSRGVGNKIGSYFTELAKKEMDRLDRRLPNRDLAYLEEGTSHFDDYVEAVSWAQDYARTNRDIMLDQVIRAVRKLLPMQFTLTDEAINCHHNYVQKESHFGEEMFITRKGAVSARTGELGIIPGSMGTRSYIVRGLGNPESFHSCSHGAGRVMARGVAKASITLEMHREATKGVECRKDRDVIDESPAAYKDIDAVMDAQKDLVEVVHQLKQIVCIKG